MIRLAKAQDFESFVPDSEGAVRILGLIAAYGADRPFIRCWCVLCGAEIAGFVSLLDGAATLTMRDGGVTEELAAFLGMQPEIQSVRTSGAAARTLAAFGGWSVETGSVMTPGGQQKEPEQRPEELSAREVYPVLKNCFTELPPFESWYADVSHRVRHGCCRIVGFREEGKPVACAMTTAECQNAAVIGGVATLPEGRGKGYASANVLTLARTLQGEGKRVFLSPKNEHARALYVGLGFVECGQWGSLNRS